MQQPNDITFEQIRERAYDLWERNHRPEGMEEQFWLAAEQELRAERTARDVDEAIKDRSERLWWCSRISDALADTQ